MRVLSVVNGAFMVDFIGSYTAANFPGKTFSPCSLPLVSKVALLLFPRISPLQYQAEDLLQIFILLSVAQGEDVTTSRCTTQL